MTASARLDVTAQGARCVGRFLPCAIGRGGIGVKRGEGDNVTPQGLHHVVGLLFRSDRVAADCLPPWARPIGLRDLWSDDPADPAYNCPVRAPHPFGHECLRRADQLYDVILLTDWNMAPCRAGAGSAIFIHAWRRARYPTAGCIAFAPAALRWLAWQLPPGAEIRIRGAAAPILPRFRDYP